MMVTRILGLLLLMGVMFVTETSGTETCVTPKTSGTVRVSLSSRRNQTGHWLAQVRCFNCKITSLSCNNVPVQLETTEDGKESDWVEVDVQRRTATCKDSSATHIAMTITGPPLQQTFPGYEHFPGVGYYKFHTKSAVWWDARRICASEGAHLAIINSDEESAALRELFARYPKLEDVQYDQVAFIGFHDLYVDGEFLTVFDEPLNSTGFTKWDIGQPDNFRGGMGENCGSIFRSGLLNDLLCHLKYAFICELELS